MQTPPRFGSSHDGDSVGSVAKFAIVPSMQSQLKTVESLLADLESNNSEYPCWKLALVQQSCVRTRVLH